MIPVPLVFFGKLPFHLSLQSTRCPSLSLCHQAWTGHGPLSQTNLSHHSCPNTSFNLRQEFTLVTLPKAPHEHYTCRFSVRTKGHPKSLKKNHRKVSLGCSKEKSGGKWLPASLNPLSQVFGCCRFTLSHCLVFLVSQIVPSGRSTFSTCL